MFLIKSNKSPFFQLVYSRNGKRTTVSTKTNRLGEAVKFIRQFQIQLEAKEKEPLIILSKFIEEYLAYSRLHQSEAYYKRCILPAINSSPKELVSSPITEINSRELEMMLLNLFSKKPYKALADYRVLKAMFNKAILWDYIQLNPLRKIKMPKMPAKYPIFIQRNELELILTNLECEALKDITEFAFNTGMRLSEITNLKWEQIDFNKEVVNVSNTDTFTTKSKKDRIVPMSKSVKEILQRRKTTVEDLPVYVFWDDKGIKFKKDYVSRNFKKALRKTDLNPKIKFHTLRHSFASCLASKGVSLYIIKELLGHSDITTTQIYAHLRSDDLRNAVELMN